MKNEVIRCPLFHPLTLNSSLSLSLSLSSPLASSTTFRFSLVHFYHLSLSPQTLTDLGGIRLAIHSSLISLSLSLSSALSETYHPV